MGQLMLFPFNWAPRGWAKCDGQLMAISANSALFSLLGTTYGGDGRTTFALPDLRGRIPMHYGQGAGRTPFPIGAATGSESTTLTAANLPNSPVTILASEEDATLSEPEGNVLAAGTFYAPGNTGSVSLGGTSGGGGASIPFNNMQPSLAMNWCIATMGIYPSRS